MEKFKINKLSKGEIIGLIGIVASIAFGANWYFFPSSKEYAPQSIGDNSTGNFQLQGENINVNMPPPFELAYKTIKENEEREDGLYQNIFELSITRPGGNFQKGFSILKNINNADCSEAKEIGTEAVSSSGRQVYEISTYNIGCISKLPITDSGIFFAVRGID